MSADAIDAAIHYGWPILKLSKPDSGGTSPGKRPVGKNWETRSGMTAAAAKAWLNEGGNIGLRTGGNLLVVDCDGERPPNLPETPTVRTGSGGLHLYYRVPDTTELRIGTTVDWIYPHTDTRGKGGQVVAAGSIHAETGALYEWLPGLSPANITLAPIPQWVVDAINNTETPPWRVKKPQARAAAPRQFIYNENPYYAAAISSAITNVMNAPEGQRNETLNREAFSLAGFHDIDVHGVLFQPAVISGLPEAEVRNTLDSAVPKGRAKPRTIPPDSRACATAVPTATQAPAQPMEAGRVDSDKPRALAEKYMAERHHNKTLHYWRGDWYHYTGTHYVTYSAEELHRDISTELNFWHFFKKTDRGESKRDIRDSIKNSLISDVTSQLRGMCLISDRDEVPRWIGESNRPPARDWLALQNGLLHLVLNHDTDPPVRDFVDHTPKLFNTTALPFNYDPNAESPEVWIDFLSRTWPGDRGADCALLLGEWFGYCLSRDMSHHKMLWLIGPTRSGKGVISRVLEALLGTENSCNPTLSAFGERRGMQSIIGTRLAVIGDARLGKRNDESAIIERLLSISGGDKQTISRIYQTDWTGQLDCKILMLSNELPRLSDSSGALLARLLLLETTQSHLGREDRYLESKIKRELPGILNWALDGLERLNQQGRFTEPESSRSIMAAFRSVSAPLTTFLEDYCEVGEGYTGGVTDVYAAYVTWAESEGITRPYSRQKFGVALRSVVPGLDRFRPGVGRGRAWYYTGIRLAR